MLLKSKKFLTLAVDTVISLAMFFGAKYLAPSAFEDIKLVIVSVQPLILLVVADMATEEFMARIK